MNCSEFRRALGANPHDTSPDVLAHRASCAACEEYARETQRLDGLIKRALEVPLPTPAANEAAYGGGVPSGRRWSPRWFAMAASLLLTIGAVVGVLTLSTSRESLAHDVVAHLAHDPQAMTVSERRVSNQLLEAALAAKGAHLVRPLEDVSYAQSCLLRKHFVPHLVVQTPAGPVTAILLPEEAVPKVQRFEEGQYRGILLPMSKGGLAVIATDAKLADSVADKLRAAIAFN